MLASADSENAVHLWLTDENRPLTILHEQTGEVRCLAFTPDDGKGNLASPMLAWGTADRVIHLWDSKQLTAGADSIDPVGSRTVVAVSAAGRRLHSLGAGTGLRTWDVESGESIFTLEGEPLLRTFAVSPDGNWLAAARTESMGSRDDLATLAIYDAATGKRHSICEGQMAPLTSLAFSPDGTLLASSGVQSSDVWLWKVPTGEPALIIPDAVDDCSVDALAFQPGGRLLALAGIDWLATSGNDGWLVLWDLVENKSRTSLPGGVTAMAFHPAGRLLAFASLNRSVRVWDTKENRVVLRESREIDTARGVRLWDVVEDRVVLELKGYEDTFGCLAWSPEGQIVRTTRKGSLAWTITCLAWSPDGLLLASGGEDRVVRLWDPVTGELAGAWELDNAINSLAFTPDGKYLYTGNGNTSCYQIEVEQLLASVS